MVLAAPRDTALVTSKHNIVVLVVEMTERRAKRLRDCFEHLLRQLRIHLEHLQKPFVAMTTNEFGAKSAETPLQLQVLLECGGLTSKAFHYHPNDRIDLGNSKMLVQRASSRLWHASIDEIHNQLHERLGHQTHEQVAYFQRRTQSRR